MSSVGDRVQWTHVSKRGRQISMSTVTGYVHEVRGDKLRVRRGKNGKKDYWIPASAVMKVGEPNKQFGVFIQALAKGAGEER